jgi:hypothetical protein
MGSSLKKAARLVFCGGTCAGNDWRTEWFIPFLLSLGFTMDEIFDPKLPDDVLWDDAIAAAEDSAKKSATHMVFYLGDPKDLKDPQNKTSTYSMWEAVWALADDSERTIVIVDTKNVKGYPLQRLKDILNLLREWFPDGNICTSPEEGMEWFRRQFTLPTLEDNLILLDGTVGSHPMRQEIVQKLLAAGVPDQILKNSAFAQYRATEKRLEAKWREQATLLVYGIGSPMQSDNTWLSEKALMIAQHSVRINQARSVVYFDYRGLRPGTHPFKTLAKMEKDLRQRFPNANIFNSQDDMVAWIVNRLGL